MPAIIRGDDPVYSLPVQRMPKPGMKLLPATVSDINTGFL